MKIRIPVLVLLLVVSAPLLVSAAPPAAVVHESHAGFHGIEFPADPALPPASPASLQALADRRFGLFLHWGPVTLAGTELGWSRGEKIPAADYDQLYRRFNPAKFDADEWVRIAQAAGMRYIVLTAKHMDGFCLWDTKQTDYNIMNSPFRRDIVRELAAACRRGGLGFGVYYCIADWHHPWFPYSAAYRGVSDTVLKPTTDLERYTQYMMSQLAELVTGYGPLLCVWFDSMAGAHWPEQGQRLVPFLRALQPSILVNDRAAVAGDYVTPEERIGRYRDDRRWESCMMLGTQWAWKPDDTLKPFARVLRALLSCAGGDGNLLLNVGPTAEGLIEPRQAERLKQVGDWLARYGESIYGTRGGPYRPTSYLASTRRDHRVYLHVLRWDHDQLVLPPLPCKVLRATLLTGGAVTVRQTADALTVEVAPADRQAVDTLVRLELAESAAGLRPIALPAEITVAASVNPELAALAVDSDPDTEWSAPAGQTAGTLEVTFDRRRTIHALQLEEKSRPIRLKSWTADWWDGTRWVHLVTKEQEANYRTEFSPVTTRKLRLQILNMEQTATVAEIRVEDAGE